MFFVFVALGFGAVYLIWLFLGYLVVRGAASLVVWLATKCGKDRGVEAGEPDSGTDTLFFVFAALFAGFGLYVVALAASAPDRSWYDIAHNLLPPIFGGFIFWILLDTRKMQSGTTTHNVSALAKIRAILLAVGLVAPLLFALTITAAMQRSALTRLGIYTDRVAVIASEEEFRAINATAQRLEVPVFGCRVDGTDEHMVTGVRLWWHGIGDRTLIGIPDSEKPDRDIARIELKRDGVRIIRLEGDTSIVGCFAFAQAVWFDRLSDGLTKEGNDDLNKFASKVSGSAKAGRLRVSEVVVTGHADRTPVLLATDNNMELSRRRAKSVASVLKAAWGLDTDHVHVAAVGSRDSTTPCPAALGRAAMSDCLSPDRRVDIRVVLVPLKPPFKKGG